MSSAARIPSVAFAALAVLAGACNWPPSSSSGSTSNGTGSVPSGDAPVLDALNMTASAAPSNGVYVVNGSITFHCDDDVVHTIRVVVPVIGKTIDVSADDEAQAIGQPFYFQLPDDVPLAGAGATTYTVALITKGGAQSQPVDESVILQ